MIQVRGEKKSVVRMACGYKYRIRPPVVKDSSGYQSVSPESEILNRDQLVAAVRKHYLEGK